MAAHTQASKIYPCLPEYFNLQGKGMYAYLTGSASWFVLTLLTRVFGIAGKDGDLCIDPKFYPQQFKGSGTLTVRRNFAGRKFEIKFSCLQNNLRQDCVIVKANLQGAPLIVEESGCLLIKRSDIFRLPRDKACVLEIVLGPSSRAL